MRASPFGSNPRRLPFYFFRIRRVSWGGCDARASDASQTRWAFDALWGALDAGGVARSAPKCWSLVAYLQHREARYKQNCAFGTLYDFFFYSVTRLCFITNAAIRFISNADTTNVQAPIMSELADVYTDLAALAPNACIKPTVFTKAIVIVARPM